MDLPKGMEMRLGVLPAVSGPGIFRSSRHLTDTVADYFVNEGAGTPQEVFEWFRSLALTEAAALNTTSADVAHACKLLSLEMSLEEQPLLVEDKPGFFALNNIDVW